MRIKIRFAAIAVVIFCSLFSIARADSGNDVDNQEYVYTPSSIWNGNRYITLFGGYTRSFLKLAQTNVFGGPLNETSHTSSNVELGVELGYRFDKNYFLPLRLGFLLMFRPERSFTISPITAGSANFGRAKFYTSQFMVQAYWDFYNQSEFLPYVGGGFGLAHSVTNFTLINRQTNAIVNNSVRSTTNHLAWDIQAGITSDILQNVLGDIFVRFEDLGNLRFNSVPVGGGANVRIDNSRDLYAIEIGMGLRYNFP